MPKILSSFSGPDPIAETLSTLGRTLFGDKTASALKGEQLYALQRQNTEMDNLMARAAAGGVHNLGADPTVQAILLGSGVDPSTFAEIGRMGAATGFGANDPRTANWQIASGQSYSATAPAFNATLAEERRSNDIASADRRYAVDTEDAFKRYSHGTASAADVLTNDTNRYKIGVEDARGRYDINTDAAVERDKLAETTRSNNLASADRRYATDTTAATARAAPYAALDVNGNPILVPTADATNGQYQPILSDTQRKGTLLGEHFDNLGALNPNQQEVLDARITGEKAGSLKNYILPGGGNMLTYDGVTDVHGNPLPPGGYVGTVQGNANDVGLTNANATGMQGDTINNKKFQQLVKIGMELTNDPTLFGAQGKARTLAQELAAGVSGISAVLGEDVNTARQGLAQELAGTGIDAMSILPELYDPNLPKVDTVWGLLVYQGASALAGQENRSVSDADVKNMRMILGDPKSIFSSAQGMQAKLKAALEIVAGNDAVSREALGGNAPVAPYAPAADGLNTTTTGAKWRVVPNANP